MASSSNPVDINNANLAELKSIPNIGEKRAGAIVKLRDERGSSLEDLKTMPTIPNTIWDPLVSESVIVFRERVKQQEKNTLECGRSVKSGIEVTSRNSQTSKRHRKKGHSNCTI